MKDIWTGRVGQAAARYAESTPVATCCNACRTCVTTNLFTLAAAGVAAVGVGFRRFARRGGADS